MSNDETRDYGAADAALIKEINVRLIRIEQKLDHLTKSADASTATPALPLVDPPPDSFPPVEPAPGATEFGLATPEESSESAAVKTSPGQTTPGPVEPAPSSEELEESLDKLNEALEDDDSPPKKPAIPVDDRPVYDFGVVTEEPETPRD